MTCSDNQISVILPVYNGEKTVLKAIHSIQNQTWRNWELIIIDDASSDESYQICMLESKIDCRINVYKNKENLGLAKTMNRLVALSKGDFIAIQEQDDHSVSFRLEKEIELLKAHPKIGIVSGIAAWVDINDNILAYFPGLLHNKSQYPQNFFEMVRYLYVEQCKVVNAACMIRRSIIEKVDGPFDPFAKMSIDWQFFLRASHFTNIWGIPEVIVYMLRGPTHHSLTKQKDVQFPEARRCINLLFNDFKNNPKSPINRKLYRKALVTQQLLESRHYLNMRGVWLFLRSFFMTPFYPKVYEQLRWYWQKILHKLDISQE